MVTIKILIINGFHIKHNNTIIYHVSYMHDLTYTTTSQRYNKIYAQNESAYRKLLEQSVQTVKSEKHRHIKESGA